MKLLSEDIQKYSKYLFFFCLIGILAVSSIPKFNVNSYDVGDSGFNIRLDYLLHFLAYTALSGFFLIWRKDRWFVSLVIIVLLGVSVAFLTEYMQHFIAGRTYNLVDFYFNLAGVLTGSVGSYVIKYFITPS
ncbi:MAG: VanZ family protein [Candidatus Acetothermia bacterium]